MQGLVQLALDFFGGTAPVDLPATEIARVKPAPPPSASAPLLPLDAVFKPGTWHHPRANRLLKLSDCDVAYEFKRGKRHTIGLKVTGEGLSVSAPRWTPLGEVEALLRSKSDWVLDKLHNARQREGELAQARTRWADGAVFDFLGQSVRLVLDPTHAFSQVGAVLQPLPEAASPQTSELRLGLAHKASEAQIRDAAQAWLMRQAESIFAERLDHFAPQLGVRYTRLRLSSAGTRWGSASVDGSIRLNWRLVHLGLDLVDYVVVHELSHLRHMNHSPQFWDVVASILPDHAERRQALRRSSVPLGE
jgi:predicted metal-dependent hydrolase